MILIVGLGNPGKKYEKNRHNIGFILVDALAYKHQVEFKLDKKFNAEIAEIKNSQLSPEPILLAKAHTFMNNSGDAIQKIAAFYKIVPENIWVIFDELDLPLGTIKIRKSGSAGTHNGMKSVVGHIGKNFPRFRIGIESRGTTASNLQDTASFVLSDFFGPEKEIIIKSLDQGIKAIETALIEGLDSAMNKFN
jgi:PTH1 family peptidyl-tRNA hydrolase